MQAHIAAQRRAQGGGRADAHPEVVTGGGRALQSALVHARRLAASHSAGSVLRATDISPPCPLRPKKMWIFDLLAVALVAAARSARAGTAGAGRRPAPSSTVAYGDLG